MTRDGLWSATPSGTASFRTRVLVHRPSERERSSGTAVAYWNNVSAGYELFGAGPELYEAGHALVAVSAQHVGIHGLPATRMGLVDWDPERYGTLHHPGDDHSFDVFTQAAAAVTQGRFGDLRADRLVAMGASQSAARLATYVNAIHPLTELFDGYMLQIWFGRSASLEVGDAVLDLAKANLDVRDLLVGKHQLRTDLAVPVFLVNSELEAIPCSHVRQPDTDNFRCWEAAGTSHVSAQVLTARAAAFEKHFGRPQPVEPTTNRIPLVPLHDAALHHMARWIIGGAPPPAQPRIDFTSDPPHIARDVHGIARGGVRLPQVEVPVATNSAIPTSMTPATMLNGSNRPFPRAQLLELYGDKATYLGRFAQAARAAVEAGVLLTRDVDGMIAEAAEEWDR